MKPQGSHLELARFASLLDEGPTAEWSWRTFLVELKPGEFPSFLEVCKTQAVVMVEAMEGQLEELAAVRSPAVSSADARRVFLESVLAEHGGIECYGTWVFVPWERKIVHVLAREDFFDVLTNRNQDKITREEQLLLRTKSVGVVGLSIGAEVAVTVAQEHLCGRIVLADFDRLDLSNLNRLSAGIDDLGVNKAHLAARRIAKIDPYLEVVVCDDGITRENAGRYLGDLDLLVDECDDLAMKYELREFARDRRINLVFAADERGMLSIEPYAHAPDLAAFHGRVRGPPPPREAFVSPKEFMQSLTDWLGGWEQISERSRQSVNRIGDTLCGYPQLASEPRLAAGQVGHVARRLLLGEHLPPFFAHLDLTEQIRT
jgi:molybdopterin/thiamine biosynthesis adenylyltransferase